MPKSHCGARSLVVTRLLRVPSCALPGRVCPCPPIAREFRHPLVGSFSLFQQTLRPMEDEDQMMVMLGAEPGSPSEAALHMLSCLTPSWDPPAELTDQGPCGQPADPGRAR